MAFTAVDKMRINGILKQYGADELVFDLFLPDGKIKFTYTEMLDYFISLYNSKVKGEEVCKDNYIIKVLTAIHIVITRIYHHEAYVEDSVLKKAGLMKENYANYVKKFELEENSEIVTLLTKLSKCLVGNYVDNPGLGAFDQKEDDKEVSTEQIKDAIVANAKKVEEQDKEIFSLRKENEKSKKSIDTLKEDKKQLKDKNKSLEGRLKDLERQLNELRKKVFF